MKDKHKYLKKVNKPNISFVNSTVQKYKTKAKREELFSYYFKNLLTTFSACNLLNKP